MRHPFIAGARPVSAAPDWLTGPLRQSIAYGIEAKLIVRMSRSEFNATARGSSRVSYWGHDSDAGAEFFDMLEAARDAFISGIIFGRFGKLQFSELDPAEAQEILDLHDDIPSVENAISAVADACCTKPMGVAS